MRALHQRLSGQDRHPTSLEKAGRPCLSRILIDPSGRRSWPSSPETPTIKTIRFRPEGPIAFRTGQFIEMTIPGVGEAPFTPSSRPVREGCPGSQRDESRQGDRENPSTEEGDTIGIRGPFGNGYPVDQFIGKEVLVVGGGCGFAPLRSLMYSLFDLSGQFKKLYFRGGCKIPSDFLYRQGDRKLGQAPGSPDRADRR